MNLHDSIEGAWSPPADRFEAAAMINELSHDITLILAQLAETPQEWCTRTGRTEQEHARWRRSALFAKAHKENQLRECKRLRQLFSGDVAHDQITCTHSVELAHLRKLSRRVLRAWEGTATGSTPADLDAALADLAAELHGAEGRVAAAEERDLRGVRNYGPRAKAQSET